MATTDPKAPQDFNALYDRTARAARGVPTAAAAPATRPAVARMAAEVPDLDVHLDEATQNPVQVKTIEPAGRLSTRAAASPETAAADVPLIWKGFAKRGIGKSAKAPPASSSSLTEVVENFDVP